MNYLIGTQRIENPIINIDTNSIVVYENILSVNVVFTTDVDIFEITAENLENSEDVVSLVNSWLIQFEVV